MTRHHRTRLAAVALAIALSLVGCSTDATDTDGAPAFDGTHVPAAQFEQAIATDDAVVLDVRTPQEFAEGHLPGAVNIDISAPDFAAQVAALDADVRYAVYCRTDNRSQAAIEIMTDQGLDTTIGLTGGIVGWPGEVVTP